jgi:hypothetical protein
MVLGRPVIQRLQRPDMTRTRGQPAFAQPFGSQRDDAVRRGDSADCGRDPVENGERGDGGDLLSYDV